MGHQHSEEAKASAKTLVEKRASIHPISPQTIRYAAKGGISPGSIENVGQGSLVPVQMCPLVPVCSTNWDKWVGAFSPGSWRKPGL
jgi:hypothetical protein